MGEVGGTGAVAAPAADHEAAIGAAAACDLAYVVGGEVGGWVGGSALPAGAPAADDGTMVGNGSSSAFALVGVGVEVGPSCCLGPVALALAVDTAGLASDLGTTAEAGAEQVLHRGLRLRRALSLSRQSWQRSP